MATARKKVGKAYEKATKKTAKKATKTKPGVAKRGGIVERIQIPLRDGKFIDIQVTIASAPKVGPGPRPSQEEMLLIRRIDEGQVLTISAELGRRPTAGISVGPGGPPI